MDERVVLAKRAANIKTSVNELASAYEALKANLNENETYTQVKCYFFTHSIILVTSRNSYMTRMTILATKTANDGMHCNKVSTVWILKIFPL